MTIHNDDIFLTAHQWHRSGHRMALAIVVSTWGSSPRQAGSLMIIRDDKMIEGSVSGGCIEGAVIETGLELISEGGSRRLDFGVADETAWQVGLSCGGHISVWVCADTAFADGLIDAVAANVKQRHLCSLDCDFRTSQIRQADTPDQVYEPDDNQQRFRLTLTPSPQLYIIGAVHISQHLAPMAASAGFNVYVIDPRDVFANAERFPSSNLIVGWPDEVLSSAVLDSQTAVVTLTHDPKIDDAALSVVLSQPVFYIASLGSRRTHQRRCDRLAKAGFKQHDLMRIHGPAGLDISAETPAEIAVSIMAEMIQTFRGHAP